MKDDPRLEEYLAVCQAMFERMQRDDTWPWQNLADTQEDGNEEDNNIEKDL